MRSHGSRPMQRLSLRPQSRWALVNCRPWDGGAGHSNPLLDRHSRACFQTEKTINLEDVYQDPRFNKEVDSYTGYHTHSLLCMPLYTRVGSILGVDPTINKKDGVFNGEDEAFLRIFANHVSVFIEIAQLHQARIEALEQSQKELELLNKAKSKALDHLSHELRTPLSVIQGNLRLLKRKFQTKASHGEGENPSKPLKETWTVLLIFSKRRIKLSGHTRN